MKKIKNLVPVPRYEERTVGFEFDCIAADIKKDWVDPKSEAARLDKGSSYIEFRFIHDGKDVEVKFRSDAGDTGELFEAVRHTIYSCKSPKWKLRLVRDDAEVAGALSADGELPEGLRDALHHLVALKLGRSWSLDKKDLWAAIQSTARAVLKATPAGRTTGAVLKDILSRHGYCGYSSEDFRGLEPASLSDWIGPVGECKLVPITAY